MYSAKLRYGAFLLRMIRLASFGSQSDWSRVSDLCDRFERVMGSIPARSLVWEGDGA